MFKNVDTNKKLVPVINFEIKVFKTLVSSNKNYEKSICS